jgi:DNA-binding NarL/FixJ family response regulator
MLRRLLIKRILAGTSDSIPRPHGALLRHQGQILEHLARGRSNDEIAQDLHLSRATVKPEFDR